MKLSEIRGLLRKTTGNPSIVIEVGAGGPMTLVLQKTLLLEELGRVHGDARTAETGLTFDPTSGLISDITEAFGTAPTMVQTLLADDLDDLGLEEAPDNLDDLL